MNRNIAKFITLFALLLPAVTFGQIPRIMNYQGKLTNPSGIAVEGDYSIDFRIYAVETGGSYIWHQTKTVTITHGLFDEQLDLSINGGDTLSFARPYWITIQIDSDPEMLPREKLAAVSLAYRAVYADTADYLAGGGLPTGTENQVIRKNASDWEATSSIVVNSSGAIGIGIPSPTVKLDVDGDVSVNENGILFTDPENSDATIELRASDTGYPNEGIAIRTLVNPPGNEPIFRVMSSGGSEGLRVEHGGALKTSNTLEVDGAGNSFIGGNLGVGTTSPSTQLDVVGDAYLGNTYIDSDGNIELDLDGTGDRYSYIDFHGDDVNTDHSFRIIRYNTGPNAHSGLQQIGTGAFILNALNNADIDLITDGGIRFGAGGDPDPSAALDISSTLGGLLIPRMTTTQRDAINVTGTPDVVMIFNTTTACFEFYYSGIWMELACHCPPPSAPVATSPSGITSSQFTANWNSVSGATGYYLDVSPNISFSPFVSGYENLDVGLVTSYDVTGLSGSSEYYYRVRAYNDCGSSANSNTVKATTAAAFACGTATVTDIDGNVYNTVLIGSQCWLKENLLVTKFNDGTAIPNVTSNDDWKLRDDLPKYCWYNNSYATWGFRGAIYNGASVSSYYNGGKNVCPSGWHVPTDAEWTALTDYLSSDPTYWCGGNSTYIAKSLANTTGWNTYPVSCVVGYDLPSNNATGFSAISNGTRNGATGNFYYDSNWYAEWWTSSDDGYPSHIIGRELWYNDEGVHSSMPGYETYGKAVRCLKD